MHDLLSLYLSHPYSIILDIDIQHTHINESYIYLPHNYFLNNIPNNLTMMNDTYIPNNYYKII